MHAVGWLPDGLQAHPSTAAGTKDLQPSYTRCKALRNSPSLQVCGVIAGRSPATVMRWARSPSSGRNCSSLSGSTVYEHVVWQQQHIYLPL